MIEYLDKAGLRHLWEKIKNKLSLKQDVIADLDEIRDGSAKGATALQEHQDISGKVDKKTGYDLVKNTDIAQITINKNALNVLNGDGEGSVSKAVADEIAKVVANAPEDFDTLKEISDWIGGHEDDASAMNSAIQENAADIASIEQDLATKITANDIPKNISAFNNDAGYLTEHQDISGKANSADLATVATSGSYNDLSDKPTIPDISDKADKSELEGYVAKSGDTMTGPLEFSDKSQTANIKYSAADGRLSSMKYSNLTLNNVDANERGAQIKLHRNSVNSDTNYITLDATHVYLQNDILDDANDNHVATTGFVKSQGYLTEHQDISGKLDKSGGTVTGTINTNAAPALAGTSGSHVMYIDAGPNNAQGGSITLYGKDATTSKGNTYINANDGTNNSYIAVRPTEIVASITPDAADNSAKIATTSYVKSNLSSYLPLSGGTLTNAIVNGGNNNVFITRGNDQNINIICGGTSWDNGGGIALYGKSANGTPGSVTIKAADGTNTSQLVLLANGTLTWRGNNVLTANGGTLNSGDGGFFKKDAIGFVQIGGGTEQSDGATIIACGERWEANPSSAILRSRNSSGQYNELKVTPTGSYATTPATTDNSTKIATTSFVNSACLTRTIGTLVLSNGVTLATNNCRVAKVGKTVMLRIYFQNGTTSSIPAWSTILTIPQEYRPSENLRFVGYRMSNMCLLEVGSNGFLQCGSAIETGNTVYAVITYIIG